MRKIRNTIVILLLAVSITVLGQTKKSEEYKLFKITYDRALRYNDYAVAKNALYNMLAADPGNDSVIYTLAYFYFDAKQYASTILVCLDIAKKKPKDLGIAEVMAVSYENLGLSAKALENYEKLYLLGNDLNALYKTSFLQFDLKRYDECKTNLDILLTRKEVDSTMLVYSFEEGKQQQFPMRVSILTLRGLLYKEKGDIEEAKKSFQEALAISPDFKLAKDNLDTLN